MLRDDATRSFHTKSLQTVTNPDTIADGARTPSLGAITFPLLLASVDDMVTVSDDQLVATTVFLWNRLKLVVEPGGAVSLAVILAGKIPLQGKTVAAVLSGGNIDPSLFAEIIQDRRHAA